MKRSARLAIAVLVALGAPALADDLVCRTPLELRVTRSENVDRARVEAVYRGASKAGPDGGALEPGTCAYDRAAAKAGSLVVLEMPENRGFDAYFYSESLAVLHVLIAQSLSFSIRSAYWLARAEVIVKALLEKDRVIRFTEGSSEEFAVTRWVPPPDPTARKTDASSTAIAPF
jgi:hypothetical protein